MQLVLGLAAMLWGVGHFLRTPYSARLLMIGLLYVAVLAVQVAFPDGHPLREATGGSGGVWLAVGLAAAGIWLYSRGLSFLRGFVREENKPQEDASHAAFELERNARHIVMREIGGAGQKRLKDARVLIVGAGGLGSPALQYLSAAGVGTIGVIDDDTVENSNLQRQVIHTDNQIGLPKVFSAEHAMQAQNPFVTVRPYNRRLTDDIAADLFEDYDLVLDCTDDAATRRLVNETCVALKLPLIAAAISGWEGQVSLYDPSRGAPCYACVFPENTADGVAPDCADGGVLGPLPGVMGTLMAVEAVKHLSGAGETLSGRLMIYDALGAETRTISVKRRSDCAVCAKA